MKLEPLALGPSPDLVRHAAAALPTRDLFGLPVAATTSAAAADAVAALIESGRHGKFAFLNAHAANLAWRERRFHRALRACTVFPDGIGVDAASRLLHGSTFPENLNGTDFVPFLLGRCRRPLAVGLLGARPDVVERARDRFAAAHPAHTFRTIHHGYFDADEQRRFLRALAVDPVDVLLVALGNPAQEVLMAEAVDGRHCRVAFGIGALFDFTSGRMPRAPRMLRDLRLEWTYRLALEPRRMWRRYLLGNPVFLARVLRERVLRERVLRERVRGG